LQSATPRTTVSHSSRMRTSNGRGYRLEAFGDDLYRCQQRPIQAGIPGDLAPYALALAAPHVANRLQFEKDQVDFLERSARDAPNQRIHVFGRRGRRRLTLAALPARPSRVAPDQTDLGHAYPLHVLSHATVTIAESPDFGLRTH